MNRLARFIFGWLFYWIVEKLWDGTSHWTMGLVGGLSFIVGGEIDEVAPKRSFFKQMLMITGIITAFEYAVGVLVNKDYKIWDYRTMKGNIDGQVCPQFVLLWLLVFAPLIIILDNALRKVGR